MWCDVKMNGEHAVQQFHMLSLSLSLSLSVTHKITQHPQYIIHVPSSASGSRISTTLATRYGSCLFSLTFSWFSRMRSRWARLSCVMRCTSLFMTRISLLIKCMRWRNSPKLMCLVSSSSNNVSGTGAATGRASSGSSSGRRRVWVPGPSPPGASPQISSPSKSSAILCNQSIKSIESIQWVMLLTQKSFDLSFDAKRTERKTDWDGRTSRTWVRR